MIQAKIGKKLKGNFALNVDFEAPRGVTVLYGPSGAGKTLTLDCIAGFATPDRGRITLDGRLLFDAEAHVHIPPRDRSCGYVFQNYALFPHMTVRSNLAFAASKLPRLERHRSIAELLDRFRIAEFGERYPRELSGGQKQRASIARALINGPKAMLLDEPGRGLDASLRADLYSVILDLRQTLAAPILLVTHDADECIALANQILIYDAGGIVYRGSAADLLRNPGSAKVASLLGGFDIFEAEVLALDPVKQTSRVRLLGEEIHGPHLRGCFLGDRITLCARPEELRIASKPGENRIRAEVKHFQERSQSIRVDFGGNLVVDVSRDEWNERGEALWVEIPPSCLRPLGRD